MLLINGEWALTRAKSLTARLERLEPSSTDDRDRIILAYRLTLGGNLSPKKSREAMAFIDRQVNLLRSRRSNHGPRLAMMRSLTFVMCSSILMNFCM